MPINNKVDEIIGEAEQGSIEFKVFLVSGYEFKTDGPIPGFAENLLMEFVNRVPEDAPQSEQESVPIAFLGLDDWSDGIGVLAWPASDDEMALITRTVSRVFKAFGVKRFARIAPASVRLTTKGLSTEEDMLVLSFVDPPNKPRACFLPVERDWPDLDSLTTVEVAEDSGFVNFMKPDLSDRFNSSITIH